MCFLYLYFMTQSWTWRRVHAGSIQKMSHSFIKLFSFFSYLPDERFYSFNLFWPEKKSKINTFKKQKKIINLQNKKRSKKKHEIFRNNTKKLMQKIFLDGKRTLKNLHRRWFLKSLSKSVVLSLYQNKRSQWLLSTLSIWTGKWGLYFGNYLFFYTEV